MPSRPAKYSLPAVVDPPERVCYVVPVPNDRQHIAAFLGQIYDLAWSKKWQADPTHEAADVSRVWQEIFDGLLVRSCTLIGGDDMQFRQNGCKLEYSLDCVNWNLLYDPTNCIAIGATQPGADGVLAAGECKTYKAVLQGAGIYLLPVPVEAGYTITISDLQGGWNDGSGVGGWYCPDGVPYVLGVCVGVPGHVGGDPSSIAFHAAMVAQYGTQIVAANNGSFTVPPGEPSEALEFFMNDATLGDNAGSVAFTVQVCATAVPTFTHTFDFTINDQGWSVVPGEAGSYNAGLGWDAQFFDANNFEVSINLSFASVHLTGGTITFDRAGHSGSNSMNRLYKFGTPNENVTDVPGADGTALTLALTMVGDATKLRADSNCGSSSAGARITSITVSGLGADPF